MNCIVERLARLQHIYPSTPLVGVGALVINSNKILLVKRKYPPGRGLWAIPGGHLKLEESVLEAAARELYEETGLKGKPLGVVNVDDTLIRDSHGRVKYRYVLVTVLISASGNPKPGSDAEDARFFEMKEALNLPLTQSTRGLIYKILRDLLPLDSPCPVGFYTPNYENN